MPACPRAATNVRPAHRLLLAIAFLTVGLGACRPTAAPTPDDADATATAASSLSIAGPCAEPRTIEPAPPAAGETWAEVVPSDAPVCFELSASASDATGVPVDSSFVLASAVELTTATVSGLLAADPPVAFDVEVDGGKATAGALRPSSMDLAYRYRVTPRDTLPEGKVVAWALYESPGGRALARWGFQVQAPLRVVQTLPGNGSVDAPVDTGIELTFSHDGVGGVDGRLAIEPPATGRIERHKRTVAFVPDETLRPATLYTVRLDAGVAVTGTERILAEPYVFQFETAPETESPSTARLQFSRHVWEQSTGDPPALAVFGYTEEPGGFAGRKAAVTTWRYPDADTFVAALDAFAAVPDWAWNSRRAYVADTTDLVETATFEATLEALGDFGEYVIRFPESLDPGYYLVVAEPEGQRVQAWLQVTDLATYAAVSDPKTLVWVNDAATGAPIAGARVTGGGLQATTGPDGVALVESPADLVQTVRTTWGAFVPKAVGDLRVSDDAGREAVVPLADTLRGERQTGYREWRIGGASGLYWRYLYTDRTLYRPTDTVHFWGVARARDGAAAVESTTVEVVGTELRGVDYQPVVLDRVSVPVGATGTYSGVLEIAGASPGWYSLRARVGEDELSTTGVEVRDFVKPAYRLEVSPDRRAALAGEEITVSVRAAFFEGSPVPGVALRAGGDVSETLTTDLDGLAGLTYEAKAPSSGRFGWSQVYVTPILAEEGLIEATASVVVAPADVTFEAVTESAGSTGVVSGTVYDVDLARVNDDPARDATDFRAAPLPDVPVTAEVVEVSYTAVETGETYDFVAKKVRKTYRYDRVETPIGAFDGASGADGRFRVEFPVQDGRGYTIDARATDSVGRAARESLYLAVGAEPSSFAQIGLEADVNGPYAIGDEVAVRLTAGDEVLPDGDQYLFYRARNGVRDYAVETGPSYRFSFEEDLVPNVTVVGVHWTGGTYEEASWGHNVALDTESRALDVTLSTERERYRPGEDVTVKVRVADAAGAPVVGARVLLSGIDAAIAQMQWDAGSGDAFLRTLYQSAPGGVVTTYASHQYPRGAPGAEGGGGGEGRMDFRDIVLFREVTTEVTGEATVAFTVPDNLTSWSITALAITDDLRAGSGFGAVPVGLPAFVDVTMNDTYLATDRPLIRLRAFGDALAAGAPVTFKVASDTLVSDTIEVAGEAFVGVDVPLPPLVEGRHELRVAVTGGEYADEVVRTLSVVPSHLVRSEAGFAVLDAGATWEPDLPGDRPVTVVLADANRGQYRGDLLALADERGDRLDQALARQIASDLLSTWFGAAAGDDVPVNAYRKSEGGLALLPYGDPDLDVSVRAAAALPDRVGRQALSAYFMTIVDDPESTRERATLALWGLAAVGEPVLNDVRALAAADDLSAAERLHLGLAAAELGDFDLAGAIYRDLLTEFGEQRGATARLNVGEGQADVLGATSLGAVLGAMLADDLSPALYAYATGNTTKTTTVVLERATFLADAFPRLSGAPASVTYTYLGEPVERDVQGDEAVALWLDADGLAALDLQVRTGRLGISTSTQVPLDPASVTVDPEATVARSYAVRSAAGVVPAGEDETAPVALAEGDLVRVQLDYGLGDKAVDGCYQLSDLLPSGLRVSTSAYDPSLIVPEEAPGYPYAIEGQRVSFCVYRGAEPARVVYYARVIGKGTYTAEPVLIQAMTAPESIGLSASREVEIR